MRKVALIIAFLAFTLSSIAQKVQKKFDHAYDLYEMKKYDSALYLFADIYNKGIGNKEIVYRAFFFMGLIYLDTKNTIAAKKVLKDILATDFPTNGLDYDPWNNPFAQFKNSSSTMLANLALDENDYEWALRYIKMADKEYPFVHFCENAHIANDIYKATLYAKCYAGLDDKEKAIQTLLPFCLTNEYASNKKLVEQLSLLIKEKFSKEEIKQKVETAKAGIYSKETKYGSIYYVNIFGIESELTYSGNWENREKIKKLKGIELYQYFFTEEEFIKKVLQN